jgi:hypothetical protein
LGARLVSERIPVPTLRNAVERAVKASSLRRVALATGMSPMGLSAFIGGTEPLPSTVEKLTSWYLRTLRERAETTTGATARAALATLLDFLPPKERAELVREFRRTLEARAKAAGVPVPDWVEELQD